MSQFIDFLVYAKDAETAREKAHVLMDEIAQEDNRHCNSDDDYLCWRDPEGDKRKDAVLQVRTERYPCDDKRGLERINQAMERARNNFEKNLVRIRYLANKYSDTDLFESEYTYVEETEIESNGKKVNLSDTPYKFWHYCRDITSDNKSGLYNIFATAVGNANQLKWILNHYRELPHVLTIGVDKDGNLVCCNTRDPAVDMPLWIVMIEIFSFTEFESIEPEPAAPIAILVNASNAESALEMAKMATKTITDFGHCNFTINDLDQVDGRMVPSAAQVSTSYFPLEDQTGLEILREYLKAISSRFIQDVTELRQELARFTNEELLNDAPDHTGKLRHICKDLIGGQGNKTFLYEADYCIGGLMCHRVTRPWYIEDLLTREPDGKCFLGLPPFNEPLWIVFFRVQKEYEEIEFSSVEANEEM